MRRTPKGKELSWHIDVPRNLAVGVDAQDLAEMLGNLVENAAQWGRTSVRLCGWPESDATGLLVEDDGPGVPYHEIETVLARGGRLDATKPGTGLGLAIVSDLVETYGGSLVLSRSPLGGLRVELRLPGRQDKASLGMPGRAFHP